MDERLATPGRLVWVTTGRTSPRQLGVILEGGAPVGGAVRWVDVVYVVGTDDLTVSRCRSDQDRFPNLALWEPVREEVS